MSNALKKITTEAKKLRKKHPNMEWKSAIKKAGVAYRAGKLGATKPAAKKKAAKKKVKIWQTGSSNRKNDRDRVALRPGVRTSAAGNKYFERRKNRSDMPNKLEGVSVGSLTSQLKSRIKTTLAAQLLKREMATTKRDKKKFGSEVRASKLKLKRLS